MRDLSIDISLTKGIITDYGRDIIKLKYKSLNEQIIIHRGYAEEINNLITRYFKRNTLDTICAKNGQVYYFHQNILKSDSSFIQLVQWPDGYNTVLATLDSLDNEIGYDK